LQVAARLILRTIFDGAFLPVHTNCSLTNKEYAPRGRPGENSMSVSSSDDVFSRYHGQVPLDDVFVGELKRAQLEPQSNHLREILVGAVAADTYEFGRVAGASGLKREALEKTPHLFFSEALERAAVASSVSGRLQAEPSQARTFFLIWQISLQCASIYRDIGPGFSPLDMDRLLRTRTLATEDIGATNVFTGVREYLTSAVVSEDACSDPRRLTLYRDLIGRLERAYVETLETEVRWKAAQATPEHERAEALAKARRAERYFREGDHAVLEAMRRAVGTAGGLEATAIRSERHATTAARRAALLESISPSWRVVFEWLLDLPYTSDSLLVTLRNERRLTSLASLNETERGVMLSDLVRLRRTYPDWRHGQAVPSGERLGALARPRDDQGVGDAGFTTWNKFDVITSMLVEQPVRLRDVDMASALASAQEWRPLCDFGLLDSAEATLRREPAPLTIAALRALAVRPSNVILPGNAGPDHDGDVWWNGAPPHANALVERYG
jgi:hypothetical protein